MYRGYEQLIVEKQNKILLIKFNNPTKKNCVNRIAYNELGRVFREVANDESVTLVVITGVGDFFTAGNDLSQSSNVTDLEAYIKESNDIFKAMARAIIECPKVIVALVNGPCIGVGVTLTGMCDMAWCSETAYFTCPFTKLGIVPELCSSYLFPQILGRSKATEMLLFGEKMTSAEAFRYNLVTKVYKSSEFSTTVWPKIKEFAEAPPEALQASKNLLRLHERANLFAALDAECAELNRRFYSEEFFNALMQFSTRKNKSKM